MKHKASLFIAIIILALGVLMVVFNKGITSRDFIIGGGILFIAAAVLDVLAITVLKDDSGRRRTRGVSYGLAWFVSVASLAFGISVLAFQSTFIPLTPYVFAALVFVGALILLYALAIGMRPAVLPAWLYVPPVLMVVAGVVILVDAHAVRDFLIMIYTGVAIALFGLGVALAVIFLNVRHRVAVKSSEDDEIKHLEAESPKEIKPLDDEK